MTHRRVDPGRCALAVLPNGGGTRPPQKTSVRTALRRWVAALACAAAVLCAAPAAAMPAYMSYWGLGWNISEAQDHVNLYWAVSWSWDPAEVLSELADAKARGMRAIVHTEFALFDGSGPHANVCPYTVKPDAAARWDAFARTLAERGLLDTVAAFYPVDEPDLCEVPAADVLQVLDIIRAHPLTAGKPIAAIFTCDIAKKFGGPYEKSGGHAYGEALRAYDWVGVDCYGPDDIFSDPAWSIKEFDLGCFCTRTTNGPAYYDNLKMQLDLSSQRLMLVPQGFIAAGSDGLPDDPTRFSTKAATDPSVVLLAPFAWFDHPFYPGVRSQPLLAAQWRSIGRAIAAANARHAHPALPAPVPPRLEVSATDVQHFSVYDVDCNVTNASVCEVLLFWQAVDQEVGVQLFVREGGAPPKLVTCSSATGYIDASWISADTDYVFDLYQMDGCPATVSADATPLASLGLSLVPRRRHAQR